METCKLVQQDLSFPADNIRVRMEKYVVFFVIIARQEKIKYNLCDILYL